MAIDFFLAFNAPVFIKVCSVQSKEKGDNYSYKPMLNVLFKNAAAALILVTLYKNWFSIYYMVQHVFDGIHCFVSVLLIIKDQVTCRIIIKNFFFYCKPIF